jgi:hypothetical protein
MVGWEAVTTFIAGSEALGGGNRPGTMLRPVNKLIGPQQCDDTQKRTEGSCYLKLR